MCKESWLKILLWPLLFVFATILYPYSIFICYFDRLSFLLNWIQNVCVRCGDCFPFICYVFLRNALLLLAFCFVRVLFTSVIFKITVVGIVVYVLTRFDYVQAAETLNFRVFLLPNCPCLPLSNSLHLVVFYIIYEGSWTSYRKTFQMVLQPSYLEENSCCQEFIDCTHNNITSRILYLCSPSSWSTTFWNLLEYRNECIRYPYLISSHFISRCSCKLLLHYSLLSGFLFSSWRNGLPRLHDPQSSPEWLLSGRITRRCRWIITNHLSQKSNYHEAQRVCSCSTADRHAHRPYVACRNALEAGTHSVKTIFGRSKRRTSRSDGWIALRRV